MVVSWAHLDTHVREYKLKWAFLDPANFLDDKYFIGDMYEKPLPMTVKALRHLWMPINIVKGIPNQYIRELDIIAGMRSGKTATTGLSSGYCAYRIHRVCSKREGWNLGLEYGLLKTQEFVISNVAKNEDQSIATIFNVTKGVIEESPYFNEYAGDMIDRKGRLTFPNENLVIWALGSNSGSGAGKTSPLFSADEVDQFDDTEGPEGIDAVYALLRNSTKTLHVASEGLFGKVVCISSSGPPSSKMWRLREEAEKAQGRRLHWIVPTWFDAVHNPLGNPLYQGIEALEEEYLTNPGAFWQLYGCNPRFTQKIYIKDYDEVITPCVDKSMTNLLPVIWDAIRQIKHEQGYRNIREESKEEIVVAKRLEYLMSRIKSVCPKLPYVSSAKYCMTGDPAKSGDSFGIALGYADPYKRPVHSKVYVFNKNGILQKEEPQPARFHHIVINGMFRFKPANMEIPAEDVAALFLCTHVLIPYRIAGFDIWQYPLLFAILRGRGVTTFTRRVLFNEYEEFTAGCRIQATKMIYDSICERELKDLQRNATSQLTRIDHPKGGSKDQADATVLVRVGLDQKPAKTQQASKSDVRHVKNSTRTRNMISSQSNSLRPLIAYARKTSAYRR